MSIRKYISDDRDDVLSIWSEVFPDSQLHDQPEYILNAKLAVDDLIFVAEFDGKLVGACMAGYDGVRGWLYSVAVLPASRRSGVGAAMMRFAIDELKRIGCAKVNLQVRASNSDVVEFYESLGFSAEDRVSMGLLTGANA